MAQRDLADGTQRWEMWCDASDGYLAKDVPLAFRIVRGSS